MTLIELLVVMSIMTIIVSAIVVAVFAVMRRGQVQGTEGLLEQLALGLEQYKMSYRMYVPLSDVAYVVNAADTAQLQRSTGALWQALELDGQFAAVPMTFKKEGGDFTDPKTGAIKKWCYYQDAWRQPLRYECLFPWKAYKLTSVGPDLAFDTGDDIVKE